jgi:hypothetical protein
MPHTHHTLMDEKEFEEFNGPDETEKRKVGFDSDGCRHEQSVITTYRDLISFFCKAPTSNIHAHIENSSIFDYG